MQEEDLRAYDQVLTKRIRDGDRRIFATAFTQFRPALCQYARRFVRSRATAEDVLQASSQRKRYVAIRSRFCNAHVPWGRWLDRHTPIEAEARSLLHSPASALELSARAYHRLLKVARTIADLGGEERIAAKHVAEALRYRPLAVK